MLAAGGEWAERRGWTEEGMETAKARGSGEDVASSEGSDEGWGDEWAC